MNRFITLALATFALAFGAASAQVLATDVDSDYWVGLSYRGLNANLHFGLDDVLSQDLDARFTALVGDRFGVGVDVLYELPVELEDLPVEVYAGGGPDFYTIGGTTAFNLNVLAGSEYRLSQAGFPAGGVFLEAGPVLTFLPSFQFGAQAKIGVNYHF
jgi:hypothetical protein